MNKLRDFFHNINDILLALIIVAAAAGIIFWRFRLIMDYPEQAAKESAHASAEVAAATDHADAHAAFI